ncbi:MAG: 2Fe-2S iron-sulfur cluster-binding protein [Robiginitomaculum sp.]|nr:2Fe-2S iron-sulfur cluster-binding protein [Robiginitomaculum sp.]
MSKFYKIPAANIETLTPDSVAITFDIADKLKSIFTFKAGQHVIVRKNIGGEDIRRTYSFCSAPHENVFRIAVRQIDDGTFSTYANTVLKAGDVLEISPPIGAFTLDAKPGGTYVGVAAGSGITPLMSMIRTVLTSDNESKFFLYYGNRDAKHTMFRAELAALKNLYMNRFSAQMFMTRQAVDMPFFNGRIDGEKIAHLHARVFSALNVNGYYLCGPKSMVDGARDSLLAADVLETNIHSELFFVGEEGARRKVASAPAQAIINVIMDGRKVEVDYRDEHGSILEAVLGAGLDASFSCKGGVCATCRAKVTDGDVDMAINYGLEPEEIADGYVLSCQSVPLSKTVTINFDA